jgi:hypothetical protein
MSGATWAPSGTCARNAAAMEPPLDERGDGSRSTSRVSCNDLAPCEHLATARARSRFSMEFSRDDTAPEQDASTYAGTCLHLGSRKVT